MNAPSAPTGDEAASISEASISEEGRATYPTWAQQLGRKYLTGTLAQFILHGNTHDLVPSSRVGSDAGGGKSAYVALRDFLAEDLFAARDHVIFYDRSSGLQ
ncbi:MAG: AAA family ATPase, partial [Bacteroidetes bacterium QS_8_68_28]